MYKPKCPHCGFRLGNHLYAEACPECQHVLRTRSSEAAAAPLPGPAKADAWPIRFFLRVRGFVES
jgi:hypothetical protein